MGHLTYFSDEASAKWKVNDSFTVYEFIISIDRYRHTYSRNSEIATKRLHRKPMQLDCISENGQSKWFLEGIRWGAIKNERERFHGFALVPFCLGLSMNRFVSTVIV